MAPRQLRPPLQTRRRLAIQALGGEHSATCSKGRKKIRTLIRVLIQKFLLGNVRPELVRYVKCCTHRLSLLQKKKLNIKNSATWSLANFLLPPHCADMPCSKGKSKIYSTYPR